MYTSLYGSVSNKYTGQSSIFKLKHGHISTLLKNSQRHQQNTGPFCTNETSTTASNTGFASDNCRQPIFIRNIHGKQAALECELLKPFS